METFMKAFGDMENLTENVSNTLMKIRCGLYVNMRKDAIRNVLTVEKGNH